MLGVSASASSPSTHAYAHHVDGRRDCTMFLRQTSRRGDHLGSIGFWREYPGVRVVRRTLLSRRKAATVSSCMSVIAPSVCIQVMLMPIAE